MIVIYYRSGGLGENGGVTEKVSFVKWGSKITFEHRVRAKVPNLGVSTESRMCKHEAKVYHYNLILKIIMVLMQVIEASSSFSNLVDCCYGMPIFLTMKN